MFHLVDNFQDKSGNALAGYYVKLKVPGGAYATIYADANETPIVSASGVADTAVTDENGVFDLYVDDGDYDIEFFDKNDINQRIRTVSSKPLYGLGGGVTIVSASTTGNPANVGRKVNLPTAGTGQDIAIQTVGGTGSGSGKHVVMQKNRAGGEDFLQALEYTLGGFYYDERVDGTAGLGTAVHAVSTRIGNGAQIETRKWITISGTCRLDGTTDDPMGEGFSVVFVPPSEQPHMFGIFADLPMAMQTRLPDADPQDDDQVHWSLLGHLGQEMLTFKRLGNLAYMDGWEPPLVGAHAERPTHVEFEVGRVGKQGFGAQAGGFMCLNTCTLADVTSGQPDPYDLFLDGSGGTATAGAVIITDAATPGLYYSNGLQFVLSTNSATTVGTNPLGWTTAKFESGGAVITESGSGLAAKTFAKTAGSTNWDNAAYPNTTHTGDQLVAFVVSSVATAQDCMVGLATAIPTGTDAYTAGQANLTGVYQSGLSLFPIVAGSGGSFTAYDLSLEVGDVILIRQIGTTITVERNSLPLATLTTSDAGGAKRGMVCFNQVDGAVNALRWRALS